MSQVSEISHSDDEKADKFGASIKKTKVKFSKHTPDKVETDTKTSDTKNGFKTPEPKIKKILKRSKPIDAPDLS